MEQSEIIRMAREAGFTDAWLKPLERFAAIVAENTGIEQQREIVRLKGIIEEQANGAQNLVLAEREACAKLVETTHAEGLQSIRGACAAAIRARGMDLLTQHSQAIGEYNDYP